MGIFLPVSCLMTLDLPTLDLPTSTISINTTIEKQSQDGLFNFLGLSKKSEE
jgi:hypothetical protein